MRHLLQGVTAQLKAGERLHMAPNDMLLVASCALPHGSPGHAAALLPLIPPQADALLSPGGLGTRGA